LDVRFLKKAAMTAAVCASLLPVGAAQGATRSYESPLMGADHVSFDAVAKHGDNTKLLEFAYSDFYFACDNGAYPFSSSSQTARVSPGRRFRINPYGTGPGDPKAVLRGAFNRKETKASGTFTVKGTFPGPMFCEGSHTWTAERT
jgi:hypothetical protein